MSRNYSPEFESAEAQVQTRPAYLYIVQRAGENYHLANFDHDITVTGLPAEKGSDPQTFTACQCKHSSIKQDSEPSTQSISLSVGVNASPLTDELKAYILSSPPDEIKVVIARVNSASLPGPIVWGTDTFVMFKGVATHISFNRSVIELSLLSLLLQNDGKVPRYFWQKQCQHALYGALCGVDRSSAAFHLDTTISAINARQRYVEIADTELISIAITDEMFQGGIIHEYAGANIIAKLVIDRCEVLAGGNPRFWLRWWSPTLAASTVVKVYRGCNRTLEICDTVFANKANFGGMAFIPDINPTVNGFRV